MTGEELRELAGRVPFVLVRHISYHTAHHMDYLNEPLNLAWVVRTPYRRGRPGVANKYFAVNARGAVSYATLAALLGDDAALAARAAVLYPEDGKDGKEGRNERGDGGP